MYVKVRVKAAARHEEVVEESRDHFFISVKEAAKQNKANTRVLELIALHFPLPVKKVRIINGHHSTSKLLSVDVEE